MGNIRNEYEKYGEAALYGLLIEDKLTKLCKEHNIKLVENNRFISLPEKINLLKSSEEMKKELKREYGDDYKKKRKEFKVILEGLQSWWDIRNDVMHIKKIPFNGNREFKAFLETGLYIIKYFGICLPEGYDEEKLSAIGELVYQSTFVELHIKKKCEKRDLKIRNDKGHRISMNMKIEDILESRPKKPQKFKDIKVWWDKRNDLLHSVDRINEITTSEINKFVEELALWPEIDR